LGDNDQELSTVNCQLMTMVYCGTSGWNYNHWRGVFYHEGLPQSKWLEHYAAHFDTVEVNNSFYRLPDTDRRLVRKPCSPAADPLTCADSHANTELASSFTLAGAPNAA